MTLPQKRKSQGGGENELGARWQHDPLLVGQKKKPLGPAKIKREKNTYFSGTAMILIKKKWPFVAQHEMS